MQIDVYDTYVTTSDGGRMHFDVLLAQGEQESKAKTCARQWLGSIGLHPDQVQQERMRYCHSEPATAETLALLEQQGYAIVQMEGCPAPVD